MVFRTIALYNVQPVSLVLPKTKKNHLPAPLKHLYCFCNQYKNHSVTITNVPDIFWPGAFARQPAELPRALKLLKFPIILGEMPFPQVKTAKLVKLCKNITSLQECNVYCHVSTPVECAFYHPF